MDTAKKGTVAERKHIRDLLKNDSFKNSPRYAKAWTHMSNAAAQDAFYHCTLLVKSLGKTTYEKLKKLPLPSFRADQNQNLSIPSLAFVVTKIYKTFDVKLGKVGRGNLNASHSHDWIRQLQEIVELLATDNNGNVQYLPTTRTYIPLTDDDQVYGNKFIMDAADSDGDNSGQSGQDDGPESGTNPLDATDSDS